MGKTLNCGQTCIAPDYILIQKNELSTFISHFKTTVNKFYNSKNNGLDNAAEYGRIIDDRNFNRVEKLLQDALKKGAKIEYGGHHKKKKNLWSPLYLLT